MQQRRSFVLTLSDMDWHSRKRARSIRGLPTSMLCRAPESTAAKTPPLFKSSVSSQYVTLLCFVRVNRPAAASSCHVPVMQEYSAESPGAVPHCQCQCVPVCHWQCHRNWQCHWQYVWQALSQRQASTGTAAGSASASDFESGSDSELDSAERRRPGGPGV
jgi:hypothetical protein